MRFHERIPLLLMGLLAACGSSGGGGSSSGGGSGGGGGEDSTAPSFTSGGNVISDEDTASAHGSWATNIQNGLLFSLTPEDPSLFLTGPAIDGFGALSYMPASDANGGTDVTVVLHGIGGQVTAPISFRVDIIAVNDPPSFDVGSDIFVEAATGAHFYQHWAAGLSSGPENESGQDLTFVVESNTNPDLFQVPPFADAGNGNLFFILSESATGEATITMHLEDDGGLSGLGAADSSESASFKVTATDTEDPSAEILYPPDGAKTDAPTVRVRGTADDAVGVGFVRVNGQTAGTSDSYATWGFDTFPVGPATSLVAQVSDTAGNFVSSADSVDVRGGQKLPINPTTVAYDSSHGRLIFYSTSYEALLSYEPVSGTVILFSEPTGGADWTVRDLAYNPSPPSLYGLDSSEDRVLSFHLDTGAMSVVSGNTQGSGPDFHSPTGIAAVQAGNGFPPSLVVADSSFGPEGLPAIVAISIASGDRSVVSSAEVGSGPALVAPAGIHYQHSLSRFLVVDSSLRALFAVDRMTGDRTLLVESGDSSDGSVMVFPSEVVLNPSGSTAWVLDPTTKKVFAVSMATGTYSVLSSNNSQFGADGFKWQFLRDIVRAQGIGLFVSDFSGHAVYSVSTSTGSRFRELDYTAGSGPAWTDPTALAIDDLSDEVMVSCEGTDAVYSISLRNGARSLVSGDGRGAGPFLVDPQSVVALNPHTLIVTDTGAGQPRVLSIHRTTGDRSLVSGQGVGGGVSFNDANGLVVDANTNSVFVLDGFDETVTRVNIATGDRSRIAGGGVGSGPPVEGPLSLAWDQSTARLLLLQDGSILTVDPVSLSRQTLTDLDLAGFVVHETSRITCPPGEAYALLSLASPLCVLKVSLSTGSASALAELASAAGPPISDIVDIAASSVRQTTYALSRGSNSIHALDESGAEQVLFSRN